jgi:hypothetical protein
MKHERLGQLTYDQDEEGWRTYRSLRRFADCAQRRDETLEPGNEVTRSVKAALERLRAEGKMNALEVFQTLEEAISRGELGQQPGPRKDPFHSAAQLAAWDRDHARSALHAYAFQEGLFPVLLAAPRKELPSSQQEEALDYLMANEEAVWQAVMAALLKSHREYRGEGRWSDRILKRPDIRSAQDVQQVSRLLRVTVERESRNGVSYLVFPVDADWEPEHGMNVVYHRDKGADWATTDVVTDLLDGDSPDESEEPPSDQDDVVLAALANDMPRARELIAQGRDINAVGADGLPPLCVAVAQMDVDFVSRLLELGADPNLRDSDGETALAQARRTLESLTPLQGGLLLRLLMVVARMLNPGYAHVRRRLREIIRLLEAAGAR